MESIAARLCRGRTASEKRMLAGKLGQEADSLLACPEYNRDSQDCKNCHAAAARRKNTMWSILKNLKVGLIVVGATKGRR